MLIGNSVLLVVLAGLYAALFYGLTLRRFAAARTLDTYFVDPIRQLPGGWRPGLKLVSAILRPRHLGPALLMTGAVLWRQEDTHSALFCGAIVAGMAVAEGLKFLIKRPRPQNELIGLHKIKTLSFPSGHAASALLASLAVVSLAHLTPVAAVLVIVAGLGVGVSRLYLQVHYPSDVVAGWLLAVAWWQMALLLTGMPL